MRLELLGYLYRGYDWPNGGVYVMYADPATPDDTWLLVGATLADIMARMGELPVRNPDPLVARIEERNREEWR